MTDSDRVNQLWRWAFGNGSKGADERIGDNTRHLQESSMGERECMAHKKIKEHLDWHKQNKIFLWAILIPVYLSALGLLLQLFGVF